MYRSDDGHMQVSVYGGVFRRRMHDCLGIVVQEIEASQSDDECRR